MAGHMSPPKVQFLIFLRTKWCNFKKFPTSINRCAHYWRKLENATKLCQILSTKNPNLNKRERKEILQNQVCSKPRDSRFSLRKASKEVWKFGTHFLGQGPVVWGKRKARGKVGNQRRFRVWWVGFPHRTSLKKARELGAKKWPKNRLLEEEKEEPKTNPKVGSKVR
jgi:hypothetical protein